MSRRAYLDWLRGVAVLIMVEAHTLDSWTRTADRGRTDYTWAIVVGASDGCGAVFAERLAENGIGVLLVARRERLLADVASGITARTGAETRTLAIDLTEPDAASRIIDDTADLEIGMLVYCAGGDPNYQPFLANPVSAAEALLLRNCLVMMRLCHHFAGQMVDYNYTSVLPGPNLWERLRSSGVEPITVQPDAFEGSPLSRLLYRGARFEGTWDDRDLVEATVALAAEPGRFIFTYYWPVDFAGHVHGVESSEFAESLHRASNVWEGIVSAAPPGVTVLGTADHGLISYSEEDKLLIRQQEYRGLRYGGDPRGVQVWGDPGLLGDLARETGSEMVDPLALLGPEPGPEAARRTGDALLLAPPGKVLLPPGFDKRLRSYHGGLAPGELEIPLLVG